MKKNYNIYLSNQGFGGRKENRILQKVLVLAFFFFVATISYAQQIFTNSVYFDPVLNAYTVTPGTYAQDYTDIEIFRNQTYILNSTTIQFGDCLEIKVHPGGKLIVDNCVFEKGNIPFGWKGIRVLGPNGTSPAGELSISNSTIRDAGVGILLGGTIYKSPKLYLDIAQAGGKLTTCENNIFDNNNCGIIGLPSTNNSNFWIRKCHFVSFKLVAPCLELDRNSYFNSTTGQFQPIEGIRQKTQLNSHLDYIKLYGISDVTIEGCDFSSNLNSPSPESGFVKICSEYIGSPNNSNRVNINHCTANGAIGTAFAITSCNEVEVSSNLIDIVHNYTINMPLNPRQTQGGTIFLDSCQSFLIVNNDLNSSQPEGLRFGIENHHSNGATDNNRINFNFNPTMLEAEGISYFYSDGPITNNSITSNQSQYGTIFSPSAAANVLSQSYPSNQSKGILIQNGGNNSSSISENSVTFLSEAMLIINESPNTKMPISFNCNKFYNGGVGVVVVNNISDQGSIASQTSADNFWGYLINGTRNFGGDLYYFGSNSTCYNYFVNSNFNPLSFQPLNNFEDLSLNTKILSNEKPNNLKFVPSSTSGWGSFTGPNAPLFLLPCGMGTNPEYINQSRKTTIKNEIKLFPNPTSGVLNLTGLNQGNDLRIYSIEGKLIYSTIITENYSGAFDVSSFANGVYFIQIITNENPVPIKMKFVKN